MCHLLYVVARFLCNSNFVCDGGGSTPIRKIDAEVLRGNLTNIRRSCIGANEVHLRTITTTTTTTTKFPRRMLSVGGTSRPTTVASSAGNKRNVETRCPTSRKFEKRENRMKMALDKTLSLLSLSPCFARFGRFERLSGLIRVSFERSKQVGFERPKPEGFERSFKCVATKRVC